MVRLKVIGYLFSIKGGCNILMYFYWITKLIYCAVNYSIYYKNNNTPRKKNAFYMAFIIYFRTKYENVKVSLNIESGVM